MINKKLLVVCLTPFILGVNIECFAAESFASDQQVPAQEQPQNQENQNAFDAAFGDQSNSEQMQVLPGQEQAQSQENQILPEQSVSGTEIGTPTNFAQPEVPNVEVQTPAQEVDAPVMGTPFFENGEGTQANTQAQMSLDGSGASSDMGAPMPNQASMPEQNQSIEQSTTGQQAENGGMLNELFNANTQIPATVADQPVPAINAVQPVETARQPVVHESAAQPQIVPQEQPAFVPEVPVTQTELQQPIENVVPATVADQPVPAINAVQPVEIAQQPVVQESVVQPQIVPQEQSTVLPADNGSQSESDKAAVIISKEAEDKINGASSDGTSTEQKSVDLEVKTNVDVIKADMDELNVDIGGLNKKVESLSASLEEQKARDLELKEQNDVLTGMVGQLLEDKKEVAKIEEKAAEISESQISLHPENQSELEKPTAEPVDGKNVESTEKQVEKPAGETIALTSASQTEVKQPESSEQKEREEALEGKIVPVATGGKIPDSEEATNSEPSKEPELEQKAVAKEEVEEPVTQSKDETVKSQSENLDQASLSEILTRLNSIEYKLDSKASIPSVKRSESPQQTEVESVKVEDGKSDEKVVSKTEESAANLQDELKSKEGAAATGTEQVGDVFTENQQKESGVEESKPSVESKDAPQAAAGDTDPKAVTGQAEDGEKQQSELKGESQGDETASKGETKEGEESAGGSVEKVADVEEPKQKEEPKDEVQGEKDADKPVNEQDESPADGDNQEKPNAEEQKQAVESKDVPQSEETASSENIDTVSEKVEAEATPEEVAQVDGQNGNIDAKPENEQKEEEQSKKSEDGASKPGPETDASEGGNKEQGNVSTIADQDDVVSADSAASVSQGLSPTSAPKDIGITNSAEASKKLVESFETLGRVSQAASRLVASSAS